MRSAAVSVKTLVAALLLVPSALAAEPVVVGAPELLVDETVELGTPGVGRDFITWIDQRPVSGSASNNVFLQFHRERETFALNITFESESHQAANGPWVAYARSVTAEPVKGEPRPRPTLDLVVYSVDKKEEVHKSGTRDRNEMMFAIAGDRLVFATELIQGNTTKPQRVEIMDLVGSNAFKPRVLRDTGAQALQQIHPAISQSHVVFLERESPEQGSPYHIVAVELRSGAHQIVAPAKAGIGYAAPDLEGSRLLYTAYDQSTNTSYAVLHDLAANREIARWAAEPTDNFRSFDQRGDLLVAEVARDAGAGIASKRHLLAWCLPDGEPAPLPDTYIQEAEYPALTPWGTVVYLSPQRTAVYIYERPIGCGSLPAFAQEGGFIPGLDAAFAAVALMAALALGRRKP